MWPVDREKAGRLVDFIFYGIGRNHFDKGSDRFGCFVADGNTGPGVGLKEAAKRGQ